MPKKSQTALSKGLSRVDIFVDPIQLNTEGDTTLSSNLGGIISAAVIIFLLVQFIIQIVAIGERRNPNVVQMNEYDDDPRILALNSSNNFIFAVGMTIDNKYINITNNSLLSFTSTYTHQSRSSSGVISRDVHKILWGPCTQDHFPESIFLNGYNTLSLQYAYCPTGIDWTNPTTLICPNDIKASYPDCIAPVNVQIRGTYLELDFDYVQFKLHACNASDAATIKGLTCTTDDTTTIFANSEVKMNLYYSNVLIDPLNYDYPNDTIIDTFYWSVNPSVSKVTDIYVDTTTVQDYNDFWSTTSYRNRTFYSFALEKARDMQAFNTGSMLEWNIRRSHLNLLTIRKYAKILDAVSNIGGLSKVLVIIGAFIAVGYNRFKHQMMLSNKLYEFEPAKRKLDKRQTLKKATSGHFEKKKSGFMSRISLSSSPKKPASNTDQNIKEYFALKTKSTETLKYNEITYFKGIFSRLCCCKPSQETQLADKARFQIMRDLDIIKIVEKLKEIDKLKMLLLNRHQREAFNFIEKPLITLKDRKPQHRGSIELQNRYKAGTPDDLESPENPENPESPINDGSPVNGDSPDNFDSPGQQEGKVFNPREEYNSLSKYSRLYTSYLNLKEDTDPRNWKYNKKLLHMIGKELIEVFQHVDELMGDSIDPKRFEEVIEKIVNKPIIEEGSESPRDVLKVDTAV